MELSAKPTPIGERAMAETMARAFRAVFGRWPSAKLAHVALAVLAHENARGTRIIRFNWGNLGGGARWHGDFWRHPTGDPNAPARFRAYPSHVDGARAWWRELAATFPGVLVRMLEGDPAAVVAELYRSSYVVGGDPAAYRRNVETLAHEYERRGIMRGLVESWGPFLASAGLGLGVVAVAAAVRYARG